jgi:hypothetical protein
VMELLEMADDTEDVAAPLSKGAELTDEAM